MRRYSTDLNRDLKIVQSLETVEQNVWLYNEPRRKCSFSKVTSMYSHVFLLWKKPVKCQIKDSKCLHCGKVWHIKAVVTVTRQQIKLINWQ